MRKSSLVMPDSFIEKLKAKWDEEKFVCVGLDSDYEKIPQSLKEQHKNSEVPVEAALYEFNKSIIDSTHDLICAYKINSAFYEAEGVEGFRALEKTIRYLKENYPEIPVILDAKRADIGPTNKGYTKAYFDKMGVDAITVNPYLGKEALQPFLDYKNKGIIVLVKTSNPGSNEFQREIVDANELPMSHLYELVAHNVAKYWNENGNCTIVVGATFPQDLKEVREIVGDMPILVPGIGAQGGDLEGVIKNGLDSKKQGLIISSSRGIIFSENPREATEKLHKEIQGYLNVN